MVERGVYNLLLVAGRLLSLAIAQGFSTELRRVSLSSFTCHEVIFDLYHTLPNITKSKTAHCPHGGRQFVRLDFVLGEE